MRQSSGHLGQQTVRKQQVNKRAGTMLFILDMNPSHPRLHSCLVSASARGQVRMRALLVSQDCGEA